MAYADGTKSGGKKKGSKNKSTLAREAAMKEAAEKINAALGGEKCTAHGLLTAIYQNEELPIELRADAAKAAIRFEKPALAAVDNTIRDPGSFVVRMPAPITSLEEWDKLANATIAETDKGKH